MKESRSDTTEKESGRPNSRLQVQSFTATPAYPATIEYTDGLKGFQALFETRLEMNTEHCIHTFCCVCIEGSVIYYSLN
jgi:hypothetical protein